MGLSSADLAGDSGLAFSADLASRVKQQIQTAVSPKRTLIISTLVWSLPQHMTHHRHIHRITSHVSHLRPPW